MSLPEPARLGEYHLLEKLGQGGMAQVYRGERVGEAGFKKKVALKRMLPQYRRDPSLLERFAAEARTNARLDHPNLVHVLDFGIDPEPYLVLEYVEGMTLASLLQRLVDRRERLEISAACFIGAEAAQGLDHAHRKRDELGNPLGIVHRDVSPQNVLLSNEGAVKVSDFGLVKAADNVVQTGSGVPIGKISYMAPEQADNLPVDARADVFALGVVIWEMLSMRTLMPPNDPMRAGHMLQTCDFAPPSRHNPNVPPALDAVVMRCLTKDPEQRTPSAQALSMQLREILHEMSPGYGRDQLARLLSWAFPEKGWTIDEPHETAAQPSPGERLSMPHASVADAIARVSMPQAPEPSFAQPVPIPPPAPAAPRSSPQLPWILLIVGSGAIGLVLLLALAVVALSALAANDPVAPTPRPVAVPAAPVPPPSDGLWIETTPPIGRVFLGPRELGASGVAHVPQRDLGNEPLIVLARDHDPVIVPIDQLRQRIAAGQGRLTVPLQASQSPARVIYVRHPRQATARLALTHQPVGTVPGLIVVPSSRGGVAPLLEIVDSDGRSIRRSTASCDPTEVCVLAGAPI